MVKFQRWCRSHQRRVRHQLDVETHTGSSGHTYDQAAMHITHPRDLCKSASRCIYNHTKIIIGDWIYDVDDAYTFGRPELL